MEKKENPKFEKAKQELGKRDPYVGIVLEEIRDQNKIIIEHHNFLERKIDKVDADLQEFRAEANEKFEAYSEDMKSLRETKADKIEVAVLERRVTRLEQA